MTGRKVARQAKPSAKKVRFEFSAWEQEACCGQQDKGRTGREQKGGVCGVESYPLDDLPFSVRMGWQGCFLSLHFAGWRRLKSLCFAAPPVGIC